MIDLSLYQYELPDELIAKYPAVPRDHSRLLVVDRKSGNFTDLSFYELSVFVNSGDSFVFNDSKVMPARLDGCRDSGARISFLLVEEEKKDVWLALAKPARKLRPGGRVFFAEDFSATVLERLDDGLVRLHFFYSGSFMEVLYGYGKIPLPPYIGRESEASDIDNYQTVYAKCSGSAAAPTAGLHFTERLFTEFQRKKVGVTFITLHVGPGTFRPVICSDIRDHRMHSERYSISEEAASFLNRRNPDRRQICVGTTCCRVLEASSDERGVICPGFRKTDIFIYPGYRFKYVNSLLTNFHLPGSTLLMLVAAFAGYELTMEAYRKAILERYRFFSYGDAMLIT